MTDDTKPFQIIRPVCWQALRSDEAERIIRERATVTSRVIFGVHAFERIEERSITQVDALNILRHGHVKDTPKRTKNGVDWKVVVAQRMPGGREAGVVTVVFQPPNERLFVVTIEWMDKNR